MLSVAKKIYLSFLVLALCGLGTGCYIVLPGPTTDLLITEKDLEAIVRDGEPIVEALARYHEAHGHYPFQQSQLIPEYIAEWPILYYAEQPDHLWYNEKYFLYFGINRNDQQDWRKGYKNYGISVFFNSWLWLGDLDRLERDWKLTYLSSKNYEDYMEKRYCGNAEMVDDWLYAKC